MNFNPGWFPASLGGLPNPRMRFVGRYNLQFPASNNQTVTVPATDLLYSASPTKQILVVAAAEVPFITGVTINGVSAPMIMTAGLFTSLYSAVYAGSGPFNIVVTLNTSSSEDGDLIVYEVDEAQPLYQGARCIKYVVPGTTLALPMRVPNQGIVVAGQMAVTDTVTTTWTGVTEDTDADAGDFAITSGSNLTPSVGDTSNAVSTTLSGSSNAYAVALAVNPNKSLLSGGARVSALTTGSGSTVTFATNLNFTGLGSFRLVVALGYQNNNTVSSVTYGGNAMTLIGHAVNTSVTNIHTYVYYIDVTQAAPTGNIVFNMSGSVAGSSFGLSQYMVYGVGSVGAVQTGTSNVAAGALLAVDVDAGGMIIGAHTANDSSVTHTWTGIDLNAEDFNATTTRCVSGSRCHCAVEVGRSVRCTSSGATETATVAFALNP